MRHEYLAARLLVINIQYAASQETRPTRLI